MGVKEEVPSISRTVMVPDPSNGHVDSHLKRLSSTSSIFSDISADNGDVANSNSSLKKSKLQRRRKRLSTLLHTHVVLILVCTLSVLDAICVIGQIICDILIMKEKLSDWGDLDTNLTSLLRDQLPEYLNTSSDLDLQKITDILWENRHSPGANHSTAALLSQLMASGVLPSLTGDREAASNSSQASSVGQLLMEMFHMSAPHSRRKRAAVEDGDDYTTLHHLTHAFHLGSMIILSVLLLECLLKVFSMGKKLLHHKLEMFDIFVVSVSWSLDVAFWEGIWAHPESEAATILIVMLPWRVIRIVNSFVLVIQEKDHVELKIVKQRLRLSVKKNKDLYKKASSYRTEAKLLQALGRKYGATDNELKSCIPPGRTRQKRKSQMGELQHVSSSLSMGSTVMSAVGSYPSLALSDLSSDDDDVNTPQDKGLRTSASSDSVFTADRKGQSGQVQGSLGGGGDNPTFNGHPQAPSDSQGSLTRL